MPDLKLKLDLVVRCRWLALALALLLAGCGPSDDRIVVTLWHNMRPAESALIDQRITEFESLHPTIQVRSLYKETEELRAGFQSAALAGAGPELVYGPSDVMGPYQTMGLLQDMTPWFSKSRQQEFAPAALAFLPAKPAKCACTSEVQSTFFSNMNMSAPLQASLVLFLLA